jgi:predicted RNA-binding protein with PUA-like domain
MSSRPRYWLVKSEPSAFSIHDLRNAPRRTTSWDGVRNYQARNYLRAMKVGDSVLFYHSNADPPAVVGVAEVVREAYPDHTAFDRSHKHFDPRSRPERPLWDMVDIKLVRVFARSLPLDVLRREPELTSMELLRRGSRLSVQPVRSREWGIIVKMAEKGNKRPRPAASRKRSTRI